MFVLDQKAGFYLGVLKLFRNSGTEHKFKKIYETLLLCLPLIL